MTIRRRGERKLLLFLCVGLSQICAKYGGSPAENSEFQPIPPSSAAFFIVILIVQVCIDCKRNQIEKCDETCYDRAVDIYKEMRQC